MKIQHLRGMKPRVRTNRIIVGKQKGGNQKSGSKAVVFGFVAVAAGIIGIAIIISLSGGGGRNPSGSKDTVVDKQVKDSRITDADARQIQEARVKLNSVYKSMGEIESKIAPGLSAAEISSLDTQISELISDMDSAYEVLGGMSDKYNHTFIGQREIGYRRKLQTYKLQVDNLMKGKK